MLRRGSFRDRSGFSISCSVLLVSAVIGTFPSIAALFGTRIGTQFLGFGNCLFIQDLVNQFLFFVCVRASDTHLFGKNP